MLRLRACTRVAGAGAGRALPLAPVMASSLLASLPFSSSRVPPKPQPPPSTPPAASSSPSTPAAKRPSRLRSLLARAAARRDTDPLQPVDVAQEAAVPVVEEERRSLAVRTGELFLGLAALLVRAGNRGAPAVEEVEARDGVVWEQRPEDVEAERGRRDLAGPGFSFSAAGLLFPYHIGVAQCLVDRGYITLRGNVILQMGDAYPQNTPRTPVEDQTYG